MASKLKRMTQKTILLFVMLLIGACSANRAELASGVSSAYVIHARRIFDGHEFLPEGYVVVKNGRIASLGFVPPTQIGKAKMLELGDSTLLPGFIESHAHLIYRNVSEDVVLRHGITTLRDLGGPIPESRGGKGRLRMVSSGPILTAPGGYPIPGLGKKDIAIPVASEREGRKKVRMLIEQGAALIKIALEPGGEIGAPWSGHGHHGTAEHGHNRSNDHLWPLLPLPVVTAIVDEAHRHGKKVSVHLGEAAGAKIALQAGADEWAHVPCDIIADELLQQAAAQHVAIVSTVDTLSKCQGIRNNLKKAKHYGATIIYGAEIAHPDIPWGIDSQELIYLQHHAGMTPSEAMASATGVAARNLGLADLGVIKQGAIADLIAVKGNPAHNLKSLEYPSLVMSGGVIVVNDF